MADIHSRSRNTAGNSFNPFIPWLELPSVTIHTKGVAPFCEYSLKNEIIKEKTNYIKKKNRGN